MSTGPVLPKSNSLLLAGPGGEPGLDFASSHSAAEGPLDAWFRVARAADWSSLDDVRKTFPHADYVAPYTVFNVKANTYRLIVRIEYRQRTIRIKHVLTHADYDKDKWK
jgi:mRNA interferase HigB